jgi:Concanavalin A-like lectin/glucanases superfamily
MSTPLNTLLGGGLVLFFCLVGTSYAAAQVCVTPPSGLVSWWPGDGNTKDIQDGNDGTLQNGATFAPGMVGQAFSFDGNNDHVHITHNANLNPTGPFSIDVWIKGNPTQSDVDYTVIDKSHGFIDATGWALQGPSSSGAISFLFGGGGGFIGVQTSVSVLDNQFHHIAGVFTGSELQIYVDGELNAFIPNSTPPANNTRDLLIGRAWAAGNPSRHFRGLVDEFEFYNRALSATEIQEIFLAGSAGKCGPCSSTVLTIAGLEAEVTALNTSSASIGVLLNTLSNVQMALDNGNNETARTRLANFTDRVVNRSNFVSTNPDRLLLVEANSLVCGAANVLKSIRLE